MRGTSSRASPAMKRMRGSTPYARAFHWARARRSGASSIAVTLQPARAKPIALPPAPQHASSTCAPLARRPTSSASASGVRPSRDSASSRVPGRVKPGLPLRRRRASAEPRRSAGRGIGGAIPRSAAGPQSRGRAGGPRDSAAASRSSSPSAQSAPVSPSPRTVKAPGPSSFCHGSHGGSGEIRTRCTAIESAIYRHVRTRPWRAGEKPPRGDARIARADVALHTAAP